MNGTETTLRIVFDAESEYVRVLGIYEREDEDVTIYTNSLGEYGSAPTDCIHVATVSIPKPIKLAAA